MDLAEFDDDDLSSAPSESSAEDSPAPSHQYLQKKQLSSRQRSSHRPYFTNRIQDQPSQPSSSYKVGPKRARQQSKTNRKSTLIEFHYLPLEFTLEAAIRAEKAESNCHLSSVKCNTAGYTVIADKPGKPIQQVKFHPSLPESKARQALITLVRANPNRRTGDNQQVAELMERVVGKVAAHTKSDARSEEKPSLHLPSSSSSNRKWDGVSQVIISVDGYAYRATTDNLPGIVQSAVATRHPGEISALKSDPVMKKIQEGIANDLSRYQPNTSKQWMESYQKDENIARTDCLPCYPYSGES